MRPVDHRTGRTSVYRNHMPDEPTPAHLAAIEREQRLLEAEVALVDAEIRFLSAEPGPTQLDWRRLRRAQNRVLREMVNLIERYLSSIDEVS
ncbi:DUF6284 family protein [Actinoplanes sp. TFC3]|uniref:DUF6284 family protein n=1 Tax=Actinoplanes sp. TFC3 TaxID=1710355 RepID=UPI003512A04D